MKGLTARLKHRTENCERCNQANAALIGGQFLCADCYQVLGSCCLEFGGDDLWEDVFAEKKERI